MSIIVALLVSAAVAPATPSRVPPPVTAAPATPAGKLSSDNPQTVMNHLQKEGYRAKLHRDDDGRPYIESASDRATFYIYALNCEGEKPGCQDMMFKASYEVRSDRPVTVDEVNAFNRENRWVRTFLDKDGVPVIEMDVLFTDRLIDDAMFGEALSIWDYSIAEFHKAIDW